MSDNSDFHFEKKIVKFTKKPAKSGDYYMFIIPKLYIDNGLIDPEKKYTIYIAPAENEKNEKIN